MKHLKKSWLVTTLQISNFYKFVFFQVHTYTIRYYMIREYTEIKQYQR